jgi:hypothetical protein
MSLDVVAILKKAKEYVAKGWVQGTNQNDAGTRVCAGQALALAYKDLTGRAPVTALLLDVPGKFLLEAAREQTMGLVWSTIPTWNDYPTRTQAEVVDTFDHAIKLAEREMA